MSPCWGQNEPLLSASPHITRTLCGLPACAWSQIWLDGAATMHQTAVKRAERQLWWTLLGVPHLTQELHLSSGSHPWPSPGLCSKWAGAWHYTLLTWASTPTQIVDLLAWPQDLSPHCGPAWEPLDCWLSLSAITRPVLCFSCGCCGTATLVTEVTVPPPSPPVQDSPCLLHHDIMLALFLMHI